MRASQALLSRAAAAAVTHMYVLLLLLLQHSHPRTLSPARLQVDAVIRRCRRMHGLTDKSSRNNLTKLATPGGAAT